MKLKQILDQSSTKAAMMKMAREIEKIGKPLAIVAVMKGGGYTAYEMLKLLNTICRDEYSQELDGIVIGHIGLESYGDKMKSQGEVKLMMPLDLSRDCIRGRKVVIVDDCVETNRTLIEARKIISGYGPRQIYTAVLVDKVKMRVSNGATKPDIVGWSYCGDGFIVGCGMGAGEMYRGLPYLCEIVEKNHE